MLRTYFIFIVLIFSIANGFTQNRIADSLRSELSHTSGVSRIKTLHSLVLNLWLSHPNQALIYGWESRRLSVDLHDQQLLSISNRLLGGTHTYTGDYDSSIYYTREANIYAQQIGDSALISSVYNNLGYIYLLVGSYTEALENLMISLTIKYKIKQNYGLSSTLNNIALVYTKHKDYGLAEKYFIDAMAVAVKLNDNNARLYTSNNLGSMYLQQGNLLMAEQSFMHSLEIAKLTDNKNWHASAFSGLGQTYFSMSLMDKALQQFSSALSIQESISDKRGISEVYYYLSKIQLASGYLDQAVKKVHQSQKIAKLIGLKDQLLNNFKLLKQLHTLQGRFDSAYYYQQNYIDLRNQQFRENSTRQFADIQLKIQEENKRDQLAIKNAQLERTTVQNYFSVALMVLALALFIIMYTYFWSQKRLTRQLSLTNKMIVRQKEEIEKKNEELTSISLEKSNLIGIVAHDLKNPLYQIIGLVNIMKITAGSTSGEATGYVNMIGNSAGRLVEMITKILDVEAVESQILRLNCRRLNISKPISEIVQRYTVLANQKKIQLHSSVKDVFVNVDEEYFGEIIENLLSNAIKYSPANKNVFVGISVNEGWAICEVRDEGPGMTEGDIKKLFRKYQRLSAMPTAGEGSTGLGLFIVKKFVDAMEGKIWCESQAGHGASFFVSFRVANGQF